MREAISVTQLNRYIKDMFAQNNLLYNVIVKGEISNFKESKGNYYFSLKDENSSIQAIYFDNSYKNQEFDISNFCDGIKVVVTGRISVYEKAGTYAIYVNKMEKEGLGDYFIQLEALKKKLFDMGMFDSSYKKPIPKYSINIGIVTAKNGAAIRDIERTIRNKNPFANMVLYPAIVQGENACQSIINGIMTLDEMSLDVIIIGRGGGSIEDLYCFNDERIAYAIFNAKTPIISAVGHEINDSISDLVADLRVATPTAAGEAATFSYNDFINLLESYEAEMKDMLNGKLEFVTNKIETYKWQLETLSPKARINNYKTKIELLKEQLNNIFDNKLTNCKNKIEKYIEKLKSRDVLDRLSKGLVYANVINKNTKNRLTSVKNVKIDDNIELRLKDGKLLTKVIKKSI